MSFEVSSSDSNFLSDSTLELEPIVPLKIRVFKTRVFHFYYYFEDPGSDSGFPFLCRLKFRVLTRTSYRIQRSCWNRSFLVRFEFFKTRVFHFYYYFEDPGSDSGFPFLCHLKFRVPTRTSYRIQRSCWNRSFYWRFEFFKTQVFHFYYYFEDSGSDSGFSFLYHLKFWVPTRTSYQIQRSCWNRSFLCRFEFFKTRVFHFYFYFEDPGSDSGFPFLCRLKFWVPTRTSYRIQRSCWNRSFLWKFEFSKLGFSIFIIILKIRVPTRVFPFYVVWSFEFRLELPIEFNARVGTDRSFEDSSFSKLGFSIFIIVLKIRVPTRVFPFYVVWSFEFRLELPIGFNARVGTDRSFEDSSFQNSGFPFLLLFWRSGFRLGFSLFMSFEVSSSDSNFLSDSTLVLEPIVPLKIRVFQNSGFPFLLLFWRSGFRLGFSLFMSFKFSSSDSNFLSDSTLVLEPIVPLKIRVFQNSGFPFLLLFWRSGFRLEFSLVMSFEVSSSDSNFLSDSTLVLEPIVPLKIRVFQNSGFPFLLLFWRSGFRLGFSLFMSFEVSSSDSNFLSDSTLVLEPIVPLKIRVFQNSGFPFLFLFWRSGFRLGFSLFMSFEVSSSDSNFLSDSTLELEPIVPLKIRVFKTRVFHFYYYFEDPGSDSGFPFLCRLKFRVPTRTSYRIQRSCWNRSFLWRFEFFKTRVFHFYYYFEDPGSDSGFPFLCRLKFRVPTRTSYRIQRSCWNRSFLWRFEFFKTRVFHFYYYFEDPGSDSGFPFLCRLKFRVPTRTSYRIQRSCWNRSFLWRFEFFKTRVFHFYYYFEDPGSDSGFPFLCRLKFRVPTRTSYRIQRSCWNRSIVQNFFHFYYYFEDSSFSKLGFSIFIIILKIRVPTRVFPFYVVWSFEFRLELPIGFNARVGTDRSFVDSSFSKLGFSIFIIILKIRVPTRVFPFYVVWSFEFRLELPIGFNTRVGTDRSFENSSFQNSGFPFLLLFWRSGFRLGFSLFMSFEVSSSDSNFLSDSTLVLEPIVPCKIRVFQNSGFPFLLLFWRSGFRLGFSLFMSFEVSSSDSNFLSDSTLVLEPIVLLKIRVFQNSGFPFLLLFWRFGFRLRFFLFISFEVLSSDSNFLSDSTLMLEPIVPL